MTISILTRLQRAALQAQGLNSAQPFGKGLGATRKTIEQLRYVQIDSLSVVARAHHHTIWTRVPSYRTEHLESLMQAQAIFEYWFHAAAYLPMSDYRYALVRMKAVKRQESAWFKSVSPRDERMVLERIEQEGPLLARDFKSQSTGQGSWWNWKPAKKTLEKLFFQGDLMVSGRHGIQKLYDLRERVLPSGVDMREPTLHEYARYLIDACLGAHGFTSVQQITHLRKEIGLRKAVLDVLAQMLRSAQIEELIVPGLPHIYMQAGLLDQRLTVLSPNLRILSPFDNALIHRDRIRWLFDYDYKIECYTPKEKRQFGYFCLPLLYRGEFIGRIDCKANGTESRLDVLRLCVEKEIEDLDEFAISFNEAITRFAKFNACDNVSVQEIIPKGYAKLLKPLL